LIVSIIGGEFIPVILGAAPALALGSAADCLAALELRRLARNTSGNARCQWKNRYSPAAPTFPRPDTCQPAAMRSSWEVPGRSRGLF